MINKDISVNFFQKCLVFYSKVLLEVLCNMSLKFCVTMATCWIPDLHDIKGFSDHLKHSILFTTSFPGSLFSAFLGRWKKDPGCGWSRYHPESGWQKNLSVGRGGRVFCFVDVTDFVDVKSFSSRL